MVCPLRFVLVFFSLLIAGFGIWQTMSEEDEFRGKKKKKVEEEKESLWATIISFFNGKYLFKHYQKTRAAVEAEAEKQE